MMERFLVDVISYNDEKDKFDKSEFECKTMVEVSRVLLTIKLKKNYYLVNVNISRVDILV